MKGSGAYWCACVHCDAAFWGGKYDLTCPDCAPALAAGSRRAKTPQAVECEASQSGGAEHRNAQTQSIRKSHQ